jgi:hypothetical protein
MKKLTECRKKLGSPVLAKKGLLSIIIYSNADVPAIYYSRKKCSRFLPQDINGG